MVPSPWDILIASVFLPMILGFGVSMILNGTRGIRLRGSLSAAVAHDLARMPQRAYTTWKHRHVRFKGSPYDEAHVTAMAEKRRKAALNQEIELPRRRDFSGLYAHRTAIMSTGAFAFNRSYSTVAYAPGRMVAVNGDPRFAMSSRIEIDIAAQRAWMGLDPEQPRWISPPRVQHCAEEDVELDPYADEMVPRVRRREAGDRAPLLPEALEGGEGGLESPLSRVPQEGGETCPEGGEEEEPREGPRAVDGPHAPAPEKDEEPRPAPGVGVRSPGASGRPRPRDDRGPRSDDSHVGASDRAHQEGDR